MVTFMTSRVPFRAVSRVLAALPAAAILLTALAAPVRAQGQVVDDWSQTLTLQGSQLHGQRMVVGSDDSIFVTGHAFNYRIVTARLAADGTLLWQRDFSNAGTREHADWMTLDPFGDLIVVGHTVVGGSATPNGHVILKYDPAGNLLWSQVVPNTSGYLDRVVTDANGDIVVVGYAGAPLNHGMAILKYSRAGAQLWVRPLAANFRGGLAIDGSGNIAVSTDSSLTMTLRSFDPAGNLRWSRSVPSRYSGSDLAISPSGELYVSGPAISISSNRAYVVKFSAAGALLWVQDHAGLDGVRLAVDAHGDVVFLAQSIYSQWLTRKLSPAGALLWTATYDHHSYNDEIPAALAIGPDDEIYVTGQGGPGPTSGTLSALQSVTVRYSKAGVEEWAATSFTSLRGVSTARLSDGSVATLGESTFTVFHRTQAAVWRSLPGGLAGVAGVPHLEGTGSPRSAAPVTLQLSRAAANAPAWIVGGLSRVDLPLFGGVLAPSPDVVLGAFVLSPTGALSLPIAWPTGLPTGFEVTIQAWVGDAAGPVGFAASAALAGVSG